jgi:hypothetical protein
VFVNTFTPLTFMFAQAYMSRKGVVGLSPGRA